MTPPRLDPRRLGPLADIAADLASDLAAAVRIDNLLDALQRFIPADAVAILQLHDGALVPVAVRGLTVPPTHRYHPAEHPRLAMVLDTDRPIRITDPRLPDPFDDWLDTDRGSMGRIHACMGSPLVIAGQTVGVVTFDDLRPHAFADHDDTEVTIAAALTAACLRSGALTRTLADAGPRSVPTRTTDLDLRTGDGLLGTSTAMRALRDEVVAAARTDLAVLITGETGVGKEVVARAVHRAGLRADRPLVYVNCAALPESIAESELFGHVRGSFTGALEHRAGKFEVADGGTLFLDEIGELSPTLQAKLLRAIQAGEIQRVGADLPLQVDVRIVAATNRELDAEVAAGRFRRDLYHRLSVLRVHVPPLRERGDDAVVLAGHFLDVARARLGLGPLMLTPEAREALAGHAWPGNVRELEHALLRAALRAAGATRGQPVTIDADHLALPPPSPGEPAYDALEALSLTDAVVEYKRQRIHAAVAAHGGNWAAAARALGLDRGNLHRTARCLGILPPVTTPRGGGHGSRRKR